MYVGPPELRVACQKRFRRSRPVAADVLHCDAHRAAMTLFVRLGSVLFGVLALVPIAPLADGFSYENLPAVAMDYKVHIDAGKEDCYFQYVNPGATFYVSFQVPDIRRAGREIGRASIGPRPARSTIWLREVGEATLDSGPPLTARLASARSDSSRWVHTFASFTIILS